MVNVVGSSIGISATLPYSQLPAGQSATPPAPGDAMTSATDLRVAQVSTRGPQQAVWVDINTKTRETVDGGFLSEDGHGNLIAGQASETKTADGETFALELLGISVNENDGTQDAQGAGTATAPSKPSQPGDQLNIVA